ncbi:hypothetical protein PHYBOEH_008413 [Phytophthora boehmeriae]|uniref:Transmembrane protein n=1 Tax=Phytophthora boehmeriae TaxID=109152 RepID=A0A8T1X189_9STRA|nr:hypothetical protein PHYBOEH_008413 [Phytophthora boehmeriae]
MASPPPTESLRGTDFLRADECNALPLRQQSLDNNTSHSDRGNPRRRRRDTSSEGVSQAAGPFRRRAVSEAAVPDSETGGNRLSLAVKENCALLQELTHLADTNQPVALDAFRQKSGRGSRARGYSEGIAEQSQEQVALKSDQVEVEISDDGSEQETIDTELLEAYLEYCKSIGRDPNIHIRKDAIQGDKDSVDEEGEAPVYYVPKRATLPELKHCWTRFIGTRYSKRRGCVQFWTWLMIGVGIVAWLGFSLSALQLNEVLHLDAFVVQNVQVTQDYTYLHILEEVDFHITYTIETPSPDSLSSSANPNASYFNALLIDEDEYEHYVNGEPFEYIAEGSTLRTTYAHIPSTYIKNEIEETTYFVVQPCYLARNPSADYCQTGQLPTSVSSEEKIYNLDKEKKMRDMEVWEHFNVTYMSVNPMPVSCSESGWLGGAYLLLFLPYIIITLFALRVFQMIVHRESFRKNLERIYKRELNIPENEVDYWQPMPWDRKVPKTRLCGPCCWKKFRRPFEPFYTWWRHENYFTWVFCPYRNEQLSRGERALIVVCSLYITFYVLFIIVMLRDSWGSSMTIFTSVVFYAVLVSVLPSAGKAIFKELFKLIFRQRRKYFRAQAAGGDLSGFSFRLAFLLQVLVAVLLTLAQGPIFYIWAFRSCLFLKKFMYFGVLAAIARMSIMGLVQDYAWYIIIKTWGWKDLCPYCTERIKHCDCFNDEVLVLAVEHVGPKWGLIKVLDGLLAKQNNYAPQFEYYTAEQLRERWEVIVERAEKHMEDVEKLRAYQEKKRLDELRRDRVRRSFTSFISFREQPAQNEPDHDKNTNEETLRRRIGSDVGSMDGNENETGNGSSETDMLLCNLREKKILALNSKIKLDAFEKHYDSNIADVFHALTRSVMKRRRHGEHQHEDAKENAAEGDNDRRTSVTTHRSTSDSSSSEGETMWVFDTPDQRLERREEEKLQRKRAFRILKDYNIESVDSSTEPDAALSSAPSPALPRQGSMAAPATTGPVTHQVDRRNSRMVPLLTSRHANGTRSEDDLVVLRRQKYGRYDKDNLDAMASAQVDDDYDDDEDSNYPSDLERGPSSSQNAQATTRVYAVKQKPRTLLRQVSTSASAFAAWALDYDPRAAV